MFWLLSGFLCEYQLDQLMSLKLAAQQQQRTNGEKDTENKTATTTSAGCFLSWKDYGTFLLNRWLRLYPLYLFFSLLVYAGSTSEEPVPCSTRKLLESLVFIMRSEKSPSAEADVLIPPSRCAAMGWSVMVDVHGYLALVLLHAAGTRMLPSRVRQTIVLPLLYAVSAAIMAYQLFVQILPAIQPDIKAAFAAEQDSYENNNIRTTLLKAQDYTVITRGGWMSIEQMSNFELSPLQQAASAGHNWTTIHSLWTTNNAAYDYDSRYFESKFWQSMRQLRDVITNQVYYTSVLQHGSSVFLGSLLYLNHKERQQQMQASSIANALPSFEIAVAKIVVALGWLELTHYNFPFSGLASYLLVDATLSMANDYHNRSRSSRNNNSSTTIQTIIHWLEKIVTYCFDNPLWTRMVPYTYGIYMSHMFVLFGSLIPQVQDRAARMLQQGEEQGAQAPLYHPCDDYTLMFIVRQAIIAIVIAWIVSWIFLYTIEWPTTYFRKRYLSKSDSFQCTTTTVATVETSTKSPATDSGSKKTK
ncbi:hypothetical protein ACA910_007227 [Epithemia clementina (nom. ined.)]